MSTPRLEINLDKIYHNAQVLVERLKARGISVTAVTKAFLGMPEITAILLQAGIRTLGDSRIENIEAMRNAGTKAPIMLIRSPMLSHVERVVSHADFSLNTEMDVIRKLSVAAQKMDRTHGIVLMVELGDLREGIMKDDLESVVAEVLSLPNIELTGIGTNLACRSGVSPDVNNMAELSGLAESIETSFGITLDIVSGGNSANLAWALSDAVPGRVNNLRIGEALLLGCEPLHRQAISGLYIDAFSLVAEVIESKTKPSQAWGTFAQSAFDLNPAINANQGHISQTVLAIGHQDTDPAGLKTPPGVEILGASSDHLIVDSGHCMPIGSEIRFQPNYSALVRAMTSPFVAKVICGANSRSERTTSYMN